MIDSKEERIFVLFEVVSFCSASQWHVSYTLETCTLVKWVNTPLIV